VTETLTHWMFVVSENILAAVLLVLTAMAALVVFLGGGFLRELWERRGLRQKLADALDFARGGPDQRPRVMAALGAIETGLPARFAAAEARQGFDEADRILVDLGNRVSSSLAVLSFLTRIGPMGGLIATLLPLGPALHGLAEGDMGELASNLTIAFTATVIGLVVSCLAYAMGLVRRTWYTRDMDALESLVLRLTPAETEKSEELSFTSC